MEASGTRRPGMCEGHSGKQCHCTNVLMGASQAAGWPVLVAETVEHRLSSHDLQHHESADAVLFVTWSS
eukprot:1157386-Pelagomonas_calceolata.AAC.2